MFKAITTLMPHQEPAVAKLLPPRVGAALMDMGTGKSRVFIQLALARQEKWDRLFWFTPCALRDNAREQLLRHTDLQPSDIVIWDQRTVVSGIPARAKFNIVGIETMGQSDRAVMTYNAHVTQNSFVCVDESEYIKGNRAKRSQRIINMSARCRYRAILTGTPISQGIVDLYSQMSFLSPKILGYRSFWSFAANHLEYEERIDPMTGRKCKTGRIIRSHNADYLAAKIAPYTYQVRKDECMDLPEKLYENRYCSMTYKQRELYEEAKEEILSLDYDDWSPIKIFHLFTSLQTIVCGFWKRPGGEIVEIEHNRIDLLMQTLAAIPEGEHVIIWAKYRHAVRQIYEAIGASYGLNSVHTYDGSMTPVQLMAALTEWRMRGRFIVATQSIGGHGLTLNEAAYSIFYADSFKSSERWQAEDRNHRIGQERKPVYISLCCSGSIDSRIAASLSHKGDVIEDFKRRVNAYRRDHLREKAIELVRSL